ncbi:MAG: hypothetical protein WDO56_04365 [Gammaproteobacteria bacterium]
MDGSHLGPDEHFLNSRLGSVPDTDSYDYCGDAHYYAKRSKPGTYLGPSEISNRYSKYGKYAHTAALLQIKTSAEEVVRRPCRTTSKLSSDRACPERRIATLHSLSLSISAREDGAAYAFGPERVVDMVTRRAGSKDSLPILGPVGNDSWGISLCFPGNVAQLYQLLHG